MSKNSKVETQGADPIIVNDNQDGLKSYILSLYDIPLLSAEEELTVATQKSEGAQIVVASVISYLPSISYLIQTYQNRDESGVRLSKILDSIRTDKDSAPINGNLDHKSAKSAFHKLSEIYDKKMTEFNEGESTSRQVVKDCRPILERMQFTQPMLKELLEKITSDSEILRTGDQAAREDVLSRTGMTNDDLQHLSIKTKKGYLKMNNAQSKIIEKNLRLVVSIAKKFKLRASMSRMSFMDIIQEGNIGLMHAAYKFDVERGYKFSTYATWWIKQSVMRSIEEKGKIIRLPVYVAEKLRRVRGIFAEYENKLGREPEPIEVAREMKIPLVTARELLAITLEPVSFEVFSGDDESNDLLQSIPDESAMRPEDEIDDVRTGELLSGIMKRLTERQREVMKLRFGIGHKAEMTLEQIGRQLGCTKERVRQIEKQTLEKLKDMAGYDYVMQELIQLANAV